MFSNIKETLLSLKNSRVKAVLSLREGKNRRKTGQFYIEGAREIARALASGYEILDLYVCKELVSRKTLDELAMVKDVIASLKKTGINEEIFSRIAMRKDYDGLIAVCGIRTFGLDKIQSSNFMVVAEQVEKPGNLGALLRTADGAGVDCLVLVDSPIDCFAPQTIRSSLGAVFSVPVVHLSLAEALNVFSKSKVNLLAADPHSNESIYDANLSLSPLAIILGSEAFGLRDEWREQADLVKIPMLGICDSLNVSVSGAILMYEALRQRKA